MVLVGQAANGVEAIAEFRRHRPDITLMDLRLPGSNGTDTLIAIRGEFPDALVKGATLKIYPGLSHGMCSTHKDLINADLLEFIKKEQSKSQSA